jgi:hypothetical protein
MLALRLRPSRMRLLHLLETWRCAGVRQNVPKVGEELASRVSDSDLGLADETQLWPDMCMSEWAAQSRPRYGVWPQTRVCQCSIVVIRQSRVCMLSPSTTTYQRPTARVRHLGMPSSVVLAVNNQRGLSDHLHRWACCVYCAANEYLVGSGEGVHRLSIACAIADGRAGRAEPPVLAQRKVIRGYRTGSADRRLHVRERRAAALLRGVTVVITF